MMTADPGLPQKLKALMIRYTAAALALAATVLLTACSAFSSGGQPLVMGTTQKGVEACAEAPNRYPSAGIPAWNSGVDYAFNWYYNSSAAPITIESVSLIDDHNLILHGAIVYEMPHSENPLGAVFGWSVFSHYASPVLWARRQGIPGAVIPPQTSTISAPGPGARDEYQVVLDISAETPAGGYAIGDQITYRQGGTQYTMRSYSGYAIGPPGGSGGPKCDAQENAINAAWQNV
jgi:hypothetical protein